MSTPLKVFIIAGEPSGDKLGGNLMEGMNKLTKGQISFVGVGGEMMQAAGLQSLFPMSDLTIMGLFEVIPSIPKIKRRIDQAAKAAIELRPDVLIAIDSPDFCLRVGKKLRSAYPDQFSVHYVAPSVWAWRPERAAKMAKTVNHVLALLPFEPPYMERAGMSCDFVGHPAATEDVQKNYKKTSGCRLCSILFSCFCNRRCCYHAVARNSRSITLAISSCRLLLSVNSNALIC